MSKIVLLFFVLLLLPLEVSGTVGCGLCLSPSFMRGISTGMYMDKNFVPSEELDEMYDRFVADGVRWVSLEVSWYQENNTSNEIGRMGDTWYEGVPGLTWSDEDLISLINLAHEKGLKVVLRPRVHCYYWNEIWWTGDIRPSDPEKWFESLRSFLSYYAKIAEEYGVDLLCVGTEMYGTVGEESEWRKTIKYVRETYKGPITYSDCVSWNLNAWEKILWADELDYMGVNLYKDLTAKDDPTIGELANAFERIFDDELKQLSARWNKQIILIEFGYRNVNGTNAHPDPTYVNEIDDQEVADICNALFRNLVKNPFVVGLFPWVYSHKSRYNFKREDSGITFEIREKPAEEVIKDWYSRLRTFKIQWEEETYSVEICSNSTVTNFDFTEPAKQISFNVTGPNGTTGFCNVAIPEDLLWGNFTVCKNGSPLPKNVDYIQTYNGTHYAFCIAYSHNMDKIEITAVAPINPWYIQWWPLIAVVTIVIIIIGLYARKHLPRA